MKTILRLSMIVLALFAGLNSATAQLPVITSFNQNGQLVCSNLLVGSAASVEWASSPAGPWQTNWDSLTAVTVTSNGTISVGVPMFYRVRGLAAPANMSLVPAGMFTMGDTLDGESDASPTSVDVSAFYMDVNLVGYGQWQAVYNWATNGGYGFDHTGLGKAANHPVQTVNWYDCIKWCNARSQQAGLTPVYYTDAGMTQVYTNGEMLNPYVNWGANGYRLPTEAEWEKAARGALSGQRFPWGNIISESQANYLSNTNSHPVDYDLGPSGYNAIGSVGGTSPATSPVGSFAPNGYGLYDMAGNAYEWCWDWYAPTYAGGSDPRGPTSSPYGVRVLRGGDWAADASRERCSYRFWVSLGPTDYSIQFGFRCVRGF